MDGKTHLRLTALFILLAAVITSGGCQHAAKPDYTSALPDGASALRKITDPSKIPDLTVAYFQRDQSLDDALDRSLRWFNAPSTRQHFPLQPLGITHDQARASVYAFQQTLANSRSPEQFRAAILADMDVYESVGYNDQGVVLFTGYYTPILTASRTQTAEYRYPLYRRPHDLVVEPATGEVRGRQMADGRVTPYPTRAQIEQYPQLLGLQGRELVWMRDKFDAFIVQVQGSARLQLTDGSTLNIGYAGSNGLEYTSVAKILIADGKLDSDQANLPAIVAYFKAHPDQVDQYLSYNQRYVFFQEYNSAEWPAGSLGFRATPWRTLATDKKIFPRASVTLVITQTPDNAPGAPDGSTQFNQFMLDQDTGGAIRAPGRADIYYGIGDPAAQRAGRQFAEGKLYYFLLKSDRIQPWLNQLNTTTQAPVSKIRVATRIHQGTGPQTPAHTP